MLSRACPTARRGCRPRRLARPARSSGHLDRPRMVGRIPTRSTGSCCTPRKRTVHVAHLLRQAVRLLDRLHGLFGATLLRQRHRERLRRVGDDHGRVACARHGSARRRSAPLFVAAARTRYCESVCSATASASLSPSGSSRAMAAGPPCEPPHPSPAGRARTRVAPAPTRRSARRRATCRGRG